MATFLTYDGTELSYRSEGEGDPLICLPGGPMRASAYLGDLGGLSRYRRLIVLDARGTGASATPVDTATYRCDRQVDDVEALRVHLGLDRIDVLAHSAAADLAVMYAARRPHRVRSLILVTPGTRAVGLPITDGDRREAAGLRSREPWFGPGRAALDEIAAGRDPREVWEAVRPFMYGRWDDAARAHAPEEDEQSDLAVARAFYADGAFDPAATRAAPADADAPVLVLAGELDGCPRPAKAAEIATLFPAARTVIQPGAGHRPWLDDPGAFTRTVAAFLDAGVHSVTAQGVTLAYRVWGREDAPPVVLAHGRGGDSSDWTRVAEELAATRRVYAPDFRGHGLSDWPGSYGFETFRDDLSLFVTALGLAPVDIVGHSMGGAAALLLAERRPELVARLVVEDAPPLLPLDPPRPPAVRGEEPLGFDWPVVPATDRELNEPDPAWWEELKDITSPTLVIGGGPTSHVPQNQLAELAGRIPGGRLVTIDAGHLVHESRPEDFMTALKEFGI
ncbi:alpha/beta fold hydrolase [Streptomyces sp. V1I6]|uniref:alpha/beta fold hydrolase n=1 Tax=Streptomyces sp. V1I6 TaxID=3042273 RepID=UPI00278AB554|nr:alpha/beta hydrolase [Streptomyces sp. V1I6]MDQ0840643.1 pimeloyl-ACP methyl ester carboxylesterase [Streptomyces sp. V1I6]